MNLQSLLTSIDRKKHCQYDCFDGYRFKNANIQNWWTLSQCLLYTAGYTFHGKKHCNHFVIKPVKIYPRHCVTPSIQLTLILY